MTDHLTDEQLNEILDATRYTGTQVDTYTDDSAFFVARHLATCDDCRARLDDLRAVFTALESLPEARLPHDLTSSILAQIDPAWGGMASRPTMWKWLIAAQVTAALAITAWLSSSFELPVAILTYQPPSLDSILAALFTFLSSVNFLPSSFIPYPSFLDLQSTTIILLVASTAALWVIGNGILLRAPAKRRRPEFIEGSRT